MVRASVVVAMLGGVASGSFAACAPDWRSGTMEEDEVSDAGGRDDDLADGASEDGRASPSDGASPTEPAVADAAIAVISGGGSNVPTTSPSEDQDAGSPQKPSPSDLTPPWEPSQNGKPSERPATPSADAGSKPAVTPEQEPAPMAPSIIELCKVCDVNATCSVADGTASCKRKKNYLGDGRACNFDAACTTLSCGANSQCEADAAAGTLSCRCDDGYTKGALSEACVDVDECAARNPCASNQAAPKCQNLPGRYECTCLPAGESKSIVVNGEFTLGLAPWRARLGGNTAAAEAGRAKITTPGLLQSPSGPPSYNEILQTVRVEQNATYKMAAIVSNMAGARDCSFEARVLPWAGVTLGHRGFGGGVSNTRIETEFAIPPGVTQVDLIVGCHAGDEAGLLYADNFELIKIAGAGICP